jgi:hypothetical protein
MTRTWNIDDATGNLVLDKDGNFSPVTGLEGLRQRIQTKLKLWRGEWFLDTSLGIPWRQSIFTRPASPGLASQIITSAILEEEEVTDVRKVSAHIDSATRRFTYSAQVASIYGEFPISV